ncbi:MAG: type I-B CRISPR-associated protein Cas8b1/Cst1 [Methanomicrobia archaeon]|nr:type I-B CRISPR-associated protein Cas8b1/Cst1 [Methanomicrobia archaeon]
MNEGAKGEGVKIEIPIYNDWQRDNRGGNVINEEIDDNKIQTEFVGDPIVDSGLMAIKLLTKRELYDCSTEDLKKVSDDLVNLYLTPAWYKEIQSIFPNSTYINPAFDDDDKEANSKEFLHELTDNINNFDADAGYCIFCGKPAYKRLDGKPFTKTQIPLIGSSKYTNFFPSFKNGIDICARCALAVQFAPLLFYKTGGKPSAISCNNKDVIKAFGMECIEYINRQKVLNAFKSKETSGTFDEGFKSPQNALFHLAYKLSVEYRSILKENEEIVIYRIDNYNQNPSGVSIHKLPNNVFKFVISMMKSPEYKKIWYELLSKHYRKEVTKNGLPIWKVHRNTIHDNLLNNKTILWAFRDDKAKELTVPFIIVERYMDLVRNMNKQRIEAIKNLADKIAICIEEMRDKRRVNDIVSAKDLPTFRNQLRHIFRDWQKLGKEEPMVTYDEYIATVIPGDYSGWREVRDLMVIRLYEKLHDMLSTEKEDEVELEGDEE